jgi:hypothetical protein
MIKPHRYPVIVFMLLALAALGCHLTTSSETTTVTDKPVFFVAPENMIYDNAIPTYATGTAVELYAIAEDSQTGVIRLEFTVDGVSIGQITSPQPQTLLVGRVTWTATQPKKYLLTVEGFRANGTSMGRDDRPVNVVPSPIAQLPAGSSAQNVATPTGLPPTDQNTGQPSAPTMTPMLSTSRPIAQVKTSPSLNVRQGPGVSYLSVGVLNYGDRVEIIGQSSDGQWWAIQYGGGTAWIFASLTTTEGDLSQVPLVAAP